MGQRASSPLQTAQTAIPCADPGRERSGSPTTTFPDAGSGIGVVGDPIGAGIGLTLR
nr:hypothetical protein [Methanoculleus marisnigri]